MEAGHPPAARSEVVHLDREQWESPVRRLGDYSYRQSSAYGVNLTAWRGANSEHTAIRRGDETIGSWVAGLAHESTDPSR